MRDAGRSKGARGKKIKKISRDNESTREKTEKKENVWSLRRARTAACQMHFLYSGRLKVKRGSGNKNVH